jgi:hypothetical protein
MKCRGIEVKIICSNQQALMTEVRWIRCGRLFRINLINAGSGGQSITTGVALAYCFGTREHKHLDELRRLRLLLE